ncbi:MAG: glutamine synthetase family protein [Actinomycetota bacterium]|nr:glutamine synthetase family protein [Actinomycetota bacterium]
MVDDLAAQGVFAVATTFVDSSGISRVKAVPLDRLPHLAAWGVGISTSFDFFRFDDWLVAPPGGHAPVGDLRMIPDLRRVVVLAAQPGWAWMPGDRYQQSGAAHEMCSRLLLQRLVGKLAERGITTQTAFEIEWVISRGSSDEFSAAIGGSAYGMSRLIEVSDYCRDLIAALVDQGVQVEQFHPEYAAGQLELAVAPEAPVDAADTAVLVRSTIRAVGERFGFRSSFSPKVDPAGVGNGGHVHLSLWQNEKNLFAGGTRRYGLTETAEAFSAGVLSHLPALLAIGAPSPVSYLRLVPQHWAGAYSCWGLENREAAMRMVTGSVGSVNWAANMEVKCFDLLANPYLLLAGLLATGSAGVDAGLRLPDPVDVDPAVLSEDALAQRGVTRLPTSLRESVDAFASDEVLAEALGQPLVDSIVAVRESELELFEGASPEDVAAATRWLH